MTKFLDLDPKKPSFAERIAQVTTPVFDAEIGNRMMVARMKLGLGQSELGDLLNVSQQSISKLERGHQATLETPFTLAQFQSAFGKLWTYVLLGNYADAISLAHVRKEYWRKKNAPKGNWKRLKGPSTE